MKLVVVLCALTLALAETDLFVRAPPQEDCLVPLVKCKTTGLCVMFKAECPRQELLRFSLDAENGKYVDKLTREQTPSLSVPYGMAVEILWPAGHPVALFQNSILFDSSPDVHITIDEATQITTLKLTPDMSAGNYEYTYGCTEHPAMPKGKILVKYYRDFLLEEKPKCAADEKYCAREDRCVRKTQMCVPISSCSQGQYRCPDMTCAPTEAACQHTALECHLGLAATSLNSSCTCSGHESVAGEHLPYFPCLDGDTRQVQCKHEAPAKPPQGYQTQNVCDTEFLGCPPGKISCGSARALKCAATLQECSKHDRCDNHEKICGWKRNKISAAFVRGNLSDGLVTVCGVQCVGRDDYKPPARVVRGVARNAELVHIMPTSADNSKVAFKMIVGKNGFSLAGGADDAVTDFNVSSPDLELVERGRYKLFKGNRTRVSSFVTIVPSQVMEAVTNISLDMPIADSALQDDPAMCSEALKRMVMVSVDDFTASDAKGDWNEVGACLRGSASGCSCKIQLSHFTTYTVMDAAEAEPEEPDDPPTQTNSSHANASQNNAPHTNASHTNAPHTNASQNNASQNNAPHTNASQNNAPHINAPHTNASQNNASQNNASHTNASQNNASNLSLEPETKDSESSNSMLLGAVVTGIAVGVCLVFCYIQQNQKTHILLTQPSTYLLTPVYVPPPTKEPRDPEIPTASYHVF